jgi:hypothetical protein
MTADGVIVTGAARDRVPTAFEAVLADAVTAVAALDERASLYVYGSVATGQARTGRSDVDLLTIDVPRRATTAIAAHLSRRHRRTCRAVDFAPTVRADFGRPTDESYGNRVFLRHYCVHLTGPVVQVEPAGFAADARAARGLNGDIAEHAHRWHAALDADANWAEIEPSLAGALSQLVEWSESTRGATREHVERALGDGVRPIVDAFAATIGLGT